MLDITIRGMDNYQRALNFYSQYGNWREILEEALEYYADHILDMAKENLRNAPNYTRQTGRLENSLSVMVDDEDTISIWADNIAAYAIEKGHDFAPYSISSGKQSKSNLPEYAALYNDPSQSRTGKRKKMTPWFLARLIEETNPFVDAEPFAEPALFYYLDDIESAIIPIAKEFQRQGR